MACRAGSNALGEPDHAVISIRCWPSLAHVEQAENRRQGLSGVIRSLTVSAGKGVLSGCDGLPPGGRASDQAGRKSMHLRRRRVRTAR